MEHKTLSIYAITAFAFLMLIAAPVVSAGNDLPVMQVNDNLYFAENIENKDVKPGVEKEKKEKEGNRGSDIKLKGKKDSGENGVNEGAVVIPPELKSREFKKIDFEKIKSERAGALESIYATIAGNGIYLGYGFFSPTAIYGKYYDESYLLSLTFGLYEIKIWYLYPALDIRNTKILNIPGSGVVDSDLSIFQVMPGIAYKYDIKWPVFLSGTSVYAKLSDGISKVTYRNFDDNTTIVEYINTVMLSYGAIYPVFRGFEIGIEMGINIIFTANDPIQSFNTLFFAGYRL